MVAAKKLYPEATIVFAGSQEKNMRDFFMESALYAVKTERLRNIDTWSNSTSRVGSSTGTST